MPEPIDWSKFDTGDYVKIVSGVPKKLRFSAIRQDITTIKEKDIPCLVLTVTEEDGQKFMKNGKETTKEIGVTSKKLIKILRPYVESGDITTKLFTIKKTGEKFDINWTVTAE